MYNFATQKSLFVSVSTCLLGRRKINTDKRNGRNCDKTQAQRHTLTYMNVASFLSSPHPAAFSFEILPPLRGRGIDSLFKSIDRLMPFQPAYINITTHRTEVVYKEVSDDLYRKAIMRRRPGSVAIAAAIKGKYGISTVPHVICSGYTRLDLENELIDLSYLGITDLLVLRGDRERGENRFRAVKGGHEHAIDLCRQIEDFNKGLLCDGSEMENTSTPFTYGVAGYPEKHEEAMNMETDIEFLKAKIKAGAQYVVTQMLFDNSKYFGFVKRCREQGITVPIIPGVKPLTSLTQRELLPKTFRIDYPDDLAHELMKCKNNDEVKALGIEWGIQQARELKEANVPSIHFYSLNATPSVEAIAKAVY